MPSWTRFWLAALLIPCAYAQSATSFDRLILAGHSAQAKTLAQSELDILTSQGRIETPEFAAALDRLALAQARGLDPEEEVRSTVDQAIALHTKLDGPSSPAIGASLNALGDYQYLRADYRGALASFEKALALEEPAANVPVAQLTATLNGLGQASTSLDQAKRGIELHERSLALREKEYGKADLRTVETLSLLARDYLNTDLARAAGYFQQALDLAEKSGSPNHLLAGQAAFGLANSLRERGRCQDAVPLYRRTLTVYDAELGANSVRIVGPLNNFGMCLKELGDYPGGRRMLERGIEVTRNAHAAANTAVLLSNLGIILKESGDYPGARSAYEQALPELEKAYGPVHSLVASNLNSLGILLLDIGDFAECRPLLERALAIYEKTLPGNPKTVEVMGRLGTALREMHDYAGSHAILERAWQTNRDKVGAESLYTVNILEQLGMTMLAEHDLDGAEKAFREVLRVRESKVDAVSQQIGDPLGLLGQVMAARGNYQAALEYFDRTIAIFLKLYGADSPKISDRKADEASALAKLDRKPEAVIAALDAARTARENLALTARTLPERQALLYALASRAGLDLAIGLAPASSPELRRNIWDSVVRDRALVLDEMSQRRRAASLDPSPSLKALFERVEEARRELAAAVIQGAPSERVTAHRQAAESAERELALESASFRNELASEKIGLADVLAALPEHAALIAYTRSGDHYFAFAVQTGGEPVAIDLGAVKHVDSLVAAWRAQIDAERDSLGRNAAAHEAAYRTAGAALRRAIWDPLAKAVEGARTVYVTPDGALLAVNLSALPTGAKSYLIETGPLLHVLTAERDLAAPAAAPIENAEPVANAVPAALPRILAMGNPAFNATTTALVPEQTPASRAIGDPLYRGDRSDCSSFDALRFAPLPGTALEAQEVARLGKASGMQASLFEGSRATVDALREGAPGARIVHLATHGFFLENTCRANPALVENPLVRSGIALAGANHRTRQSKSEDGLLTAEEAASLDLDGTRLVVLSGCDTGRGQIENGEGVLGLRRAFRIAGAATLVTSLWPAADDDTRRWMSVFYTNYLTRKLSAAEAVRAADLQSLRSRRTAGKSTHPFYWAGFVASGAPK